MSTKNLIPIGSSPGKITGTGTVTRADGTVIEFTVESEATEEQAEALNLKTPPSNLKEK
jgi:hypothetical protein